MPRVKGEEAAPGVVVPSSVRGGTVRTGTVRAGTVRSGTVRGAGGSPDAPNLSPGSALAQGALARTGSGQGTSPLTPLNAVLNYASQPVYAVGNAVTGRPEQAALNALNFVLPGTQASDRLSGRRTLPSEALPQGGGWAGAAGRFAVDIAADPLNLVTFGGASAARAAGSAASRRLDDLARAAQDGGRPVLIRDFVQAAGETAVEREAVESALRVGLRIPGSRNKSLTLVESKKAARIAKQALRKLGGTGGGRVGEAGDLVARNFASTRGANPVTREIAQQARRSSQALEAEYGRLARELAWTIRKASRDLDISATDARSLITRHRDNPAKYPLPPQLEAPARQAYDLLDRIGERELAEGVRRGSRENYVPYLTKTPRGRQRLSKFANIPLAQFDRQFFTKERITDSLDEFEALAKRADVEAETDIVRLIERRARASSRAIQSATSELEWRRFMGVEAPDGPLALPAAPPGPMPEIGGDLATRRLAVAERGLTQAVKRLRSAEASGARRLVKAERKQVAAAEARVRELRGKVAAAPVPVPAMAGGEFDEVVAQLKTGRRATPEEWAVVKREWREIEADYLRGARFSPENAESIDRAIRAIEQTTRDPDSFSTLVRGVHQLTQAWKALALLSPGYHVRNQLGDSLQTYWAGGRNPATYGQAVRVLNQTNPGAGPVRSRVTRASNRGGRGAPIKLKGLGRAAYPDEIRMLAEAHAVIDAGEVAVDVGQAANSRLKGALTPSRPGRGKAATASRKVGQSRENTQRLFLFMERLKAGDNPAEAARVVREYLFDYGDVGRLVDHARRFFMPFVTYQSKAIPMVAKTFAGRPSIPANLNTAIEHSNQAAGIEDRSLLRGSTFGIPAPGILNAALGIGRDENITIDPKSFLPFGSLDLLDPRRESLERNFGSLASTFVTTPAQILAMRNFYFNQSLEQADGSTRKVALPPFLRWAEGTPVGDAIGIGPKSSYVTRDGVTTKQPGLGYSSLVDLALRIYPIYGRAGQLQPGDPERRRLGVAKVAFGFPFGTENQARSAYFAREFGR